MKGDRWIADCTKEGTLNNSITVDQVNHVVTLLLQRTSFCGCLCFVRCFSSVLARSLSQFQTLASGYSVFVASCYPLDFGAPRSCLFVHYLTTAHTSTNISNCVPQHSADEVPTTTGRPTRWSRAQFSCGGCFAGILLLRSFSPFISSTDSYASSSGWWWFNEIETEWERAALNREVVAMMGLKNCCGIVNYCCVWMFNNSARGIKNWEVFADDQVVEE